MPNRIIWDKKESEQIERIDEEIREELIRTAEPLPESYEQRVKDVLRHLPDKKKHWWMFPRAASVAVIVGVLVVSSGVAAGVKLYQKRLESMKPEQVGELYSVVQKQQIDADLYSREMSETEEEKFTELREKYKNEGLFPKKEIACVKTEKDVVQGEVCYCYENGIFYLPEQELSEEELLQIVDFKYKVEYSLKKVQEGRKGDAPEDTEEELVDISGTEEGNIVAEKGKKLVEDLYGWSTDGVRCRVERDEAGDLDVTIEKEEWENKVKMEFEKDTMEFKGFLFLQKNELRETKAEGIELSKKDYGRHEKKVWKMAKKIVPKEKIKEFSFGYYRCKDGTALYGQEIYYLTCKNGEGFVIYFNISEEVVYQILHVENMSEWIKNSDDLVDYEFVWEIIR